MVLVGGPVADPMMKAGCIWGKTVLSALESKAAWEKGELYGAGNCQVPVPWE